MHKISLRVVFLGLMLFPSLALAVGERRIERLDTPFCIRNQGNTSTCWAHSDLMMMEQMAGEPLSIDGLLLPEIRSRALTRFLGYDTPWDGGAGPTRPYALALEHGLVLQSVWQPKKSVVLHYHQIFSDIEELLNHPPKTKAAFLRALDQILLSYVGTFPPSSFQWQGHLVSSVDFARSIIGTGDSRGYDFRNIPYTDILYGRLPEKAWTTIISREDELKLITDIIKKQTDRVTAKEAWNKAIEIFKAKRPVAFTFIYSDAQGRTVVGLNKRREYIAVRPAVRDAYASSHLVLIKGLVFEGKDVVAFEILDPLASSEEQGTRYITWEFFNTHGKTIHEITPSEACIPWLTK